MEEIRFAGQGYRTDFDGRESESLETSKLGHFGSKLRVSVGFMVRIELLVNRNETKVSVLEFCARFEAAWSF